MFSLFERNLLYDIRNDPQYFLRAFPEILIILIILRDGLPSRRMMRLSGNTPVKYLLAGFLRSMLLPEL